jgi:hypothetical protein
MCGGTGEEKYNSLVVAVAGTLPTFRLRLPAQMVDTTLA